MKCHISWLIFIGLENPEQDSGYSYINSKNYYYNSSNSSDEEDKFNDTKIISIDTLHDDEFQNQDHNQYFGDKSDTFQ